MRLLALLCTVMIALPLCVSNAETSKQVLIVTGQDYPGHKWQETAPVLAAGLAADKRLNVTVSEDPKVLASPLDKYDAIVLHFQNWEQPDPGPEARANLERFVAEGKGLSLVHFACGAFQEWPEFKDLAGRAWDPKLRGHDPFGAFRVDITPLAHPITEGLEPFETTDELYTCLIGDRPVDLLATARSVVDGKDYPMAFAFSYGKGRVFHSPLGHDVQAFARPPVAELLRRGCAWTAGLTPAWHPRKIILIAGENSHDESAHRHVEGIQLLKQSLDAIPDVSSEIVLHGWPEDPALLDDADGIVLYSDGFEAHPLFATPERKQKANALMQKGLGLVCLHYATVPPHNADDQKLFVEWMGGFYEDKYSQNPVLETAVTLATPDHAISRGLTPFTANEEFYFRLRFPEVQPPVVPILTAMLPPEAPNKETIAWARTRADGGRSFGFTGGHFHASWNIEPYRKMVLNAILWTAGVPIPPEGAPSKVEPEKKTQ